MTVVALAKAVGVSPRLVSEVERGKRPHVSLETAFRLLQQVGAPLNFATGPTAVDEDIARAERAAHRRRTWKGTISTLSEQKPPEPPSDAATRLHAVASASQLVVGLQAAFQQQHRSKAMPTQNPTDDTRG